VTIFFHPRHHGLQAGKWNTDSNIKMELKGTNSDSVECTLNISLTDQMVAGRGGVVEEAGKSVAGASLPSL
jgi:hypothetical protein